MKSEVESSIAGSETTAERPSGPSWIPNGKTKLVIRPRFMVINEWIKYSGIGRTSTYELIAQGKLKTIVVGRRRLVDVDAGITYLESLGT